MEWRTSGEEICFYYKEIIMQTIVIIGGGFAGLNLAKHLDKNKYRIKLIDRNNFHCFPPLFYQIASSGLDAGNICFPFRREFKKMKNVEYHLGHVKHIDTAAKRVTTSYETIDYDQLVIACGTTNNYFGIEGLSEQVFGIKTVAEASHTRDEILDRLERGALCTDLARRRELLRFMVVGGGPSGVEIAGAIGEMKKYVLPREYPELDPDDMQICLVEASDRLLGVMGEKASKCAYKNLQELMVDIRLNTSMKTYQDKVVTFGDGTEERWETVIWTAGVKGEPLPGLPAEFIGRGGRVKVDEFNRVEGLEDVYAIGDICIHEDERYPHGAPQLAQPAIQQAKTLARNMNSGSFTEPFRYRDRGSMATIGKNRAVAVIGKSFFSGAFAWMMWLGVHLMSLLGMRNKLNVMLNWIWNYVTYSTSLRLLLRPVKYPLRKHWGD